MAKSDYEFYALEGANGEFVVPAPASDPYHGAYEVPAIPDLALGGIAEIVHKHVGPTEIKKEVATKRDAGGYFFNMFAKTYDVIPQRASILVTLGEEDGYHSSALVGVSTELSTGPGTIVLPLQREPAIDREPVRPVAAREYVAVEKRLDILDENERPVDPSIIVRQFVPLRAYQWLPGRERKSHAGTTLPPNYSPRPVKLGVAQLIEIKGINPLVEHREQQL